MRQFLFLLILAGPASDLAADTPWQAGFARVDATPRNRCEWPATEVAIGPARVSTRHCMCGPPCLKHGQDPPHVLISVDTIGLPGSLVAELTQQIEQRHDLSRQRIVVACTHTHCAPDLVSELSNIFSVDLTESEIAAGKRYRKRLTEAILAAVEQALNSMAPAQLAVGVGKTDFAANRRVLKDGRWTGFGIQPDGPVDHSVPVLKICDADGKVRGVVFNYACHCTTLDGDYYRINADWAGYAAADLEAAYPRIRGVVHDRLWRGRQSESARIATTERASWSRSIEGSETTCRRRNDADR